ncbi:MaoC family dehydratase N-terminal domain-containing protein [Actinomadura madurae]|uniref:MaoC/PaaZ C-terminal domain-containing protein n=1 Tax=Actinomadura madurae TaxID=1993 RepID=UPI00399ADA8A
MGYYLEDFSVGDVFRTQGRTITESDISSFANLTWDTNPAHTDVEYAKQGRFGTTIAHGMLGISAAMGLASTLGIFEGTSIALLTVEDWTFHSPVFARDTITCEIEIVSTRRTSSGTAGVLGRRFRLSNQEGTVVQSGSISLLIKARSVGSGRSDPGG